MKIMNVKKNLVMGLVLGTILSGCQGNRNNSDGTQRPTQRPIMPGQNGLNQNDPNNLNSLNKKKDDIVFPTDKSSQVAYDPTNYTHVVNPSVTPVKTGYGRSELLDYTDAGNDNIMENLKKKLFSRSVVLDEKSKADEKVKKDLEKTGWTEENDKTLSNSIQADNERLARSIENATLTKTKLENKYTFTASVGDIGKVTYTADISDLVDAKKSIKNVEMEVDSSSSDTEALAAYLTCASNSSRDACSTAIVQLRKKNDETQAYIVLRNSPANLYLGEYTSKLLLKPQGDPIIDRWVQFFAQVMNFQYLVGSTEDSTPIAEIKTFAVVNGIAGFELNINRQGGYIPFVLSGPLETSKRGAAVSMNTGLQKTSMTGENENGEDIIAETLESATLVHNNGRGMLQIGLQLHGLRDGFSGDNGGVILNDKATKSLLRQNQLYNQGNQAFRTKSLRLQEKSNRALRITIVPIKGFGVKETVL